MFVYIIRHELFIVGVGVGDTLGPNKISDMPFFIDV